MNGRPLLEEVQQLRIRVAELEREAAEREEPQFGRLVDQVSVGIFQTDAKGDCIFVNEKWCQITGLAPADAFGKGWGLGLHPDDRERISAEWYDAARSSKQFASEYRLRTPQGNVTWVSGTATPLRNKAGAITGYLGTLTDITVRKKAEEALRLSESRWSTLAEAVPGILFTALPNGRADYISRHFYDYTGMASGSAEGFGWTEALHPDDMERASTCWSKGVRDGKPFQLEHRFRAADGTFRWFMARTVPICERNGQVVKWFGVCTDIDDRKRAEEALRQSEQRFRCLWNSDILGIVIADPERILDANEAYLGMVGYTREELIEGRVRWPEMTPPEFRSLDERALKHLQDLGACTPYEKAHYHKSGRPVPVLIGAARLTQSPLKWICFVLDLTQRKHMEERLRQAQKLESIGLLAGGIAHDFNNFLAEIMGGASLALDKIDEDHPARPLLNIVVGASERAAYLTRQLLAYAGKGRYSPQPVDLSVLVNRTANLVHNLIPKNVVLQLDLGDDLPPIEADASQMQQLIMNLLTNGAEAIGKGPGAVFVTTRVRHLDHALSDLSSADEGMAPGDYVVLEVRDTGCGIDQSTRVRIFEPFFTTKFFGRGLGLAAVQGIVRGHRGRMRVQSKPGAGSVFEVFLPVAGQRKSPKPETGGAIMDTGGANGLMAAEV